VRGIPEQLRRAMFYQPIETAFIDGPDKDFIGNLIADIEFKYSEDDKVQNRKSEIILDDEKI
jgi:hypothetical protein